MESQTNDLRERHQRQSDTAQPANQREVRLTRCLCGLKGVESGQQVAVELPADAELRVIRTLEHPGLIEVTDGSERYAVFSHDLVERCEPM